MLYHSLPSFSQRENVTGGNISPLPSPTIAPFADKSPEVQKETVYFHGFN